MLAVKIVIFLLSNHSNISTTLKSIECTLGGTCNTNYIYKIDKISTPFFIIEKYMNL